MKKIFSAILILFVATFAFARDVNYQYSEHLEKYGYVCEDDDLYLYTYETYFWSSKEDAEATKNSIETHIKKGWHVMRVFPTGNGCIVTFKRSSR